MENNANKKNIVELLEKCTPVYYSTVNKEWHGINIEIKPVLTPTEMSKFITEVILYCLAGENQSFVPEYKDIAVKMCVIKYYTDLSVPEAIDDDFITLLYRYDIVDAVLSEINGQQFGVIVDSINKKLDYILKRAGTYTESKLTELIEMVIELVEGFADKFGDVDSGKLMELANAVSNNKIDEGKIVAAILKERKKGNRGRNKQSVAKK